MQTLVEVCKISSNMRRQICEKVISDILDYVEAKQFTQREIFQASFAKKFHACLNSQKKMETFCIYIAVSVFLKTRLRFIHNK